MVSGFKLSNETGFRCLEGQNFELALHRVKQRFRKYKKRVAIWSLIKVYKSNDFTKQWGPPWNLSGNKRGFKHLKLAMKKIRDGNIGKYVPIIIHTAAGDPKLSCRASRRPFLIIPKSFTLIEGISMNPITNIF